MITCALLCLIGLRSYVLAAGTLTEQTQAVNGTWSTTQLTTDEDVARFVLTVPEDGEVTVSFQSSMECAMVCSLTDDELETTYFRRQYVGGGENAPVTCRQSFSLSAGRYYAIIRSYGASVQKAGKVACKAEWSSYETNESEPNNVFSQAMRLKETQSVKGCFTMTDEEDFYRFSMPESGTVRLSVTEHQIGCGDVMVWLYDSDCISRISQKQLSAQGETKTVEIQLETGEYYLRLKPYNAVYQFFSYQLKWERLPEPEEKVVAPARVTLTSAKSGSVYSKTKRYVTVRWNKISDADGYQAAVSSKKNSGYTIYRTTTTNRATTTRTRGKSYYFKVRAYVIQKDGSILYGKYSTPKKVSVKK
ncbi:MAG: hypothetical protein ACI4PM_05115 [Butyricicoccus sp.]